MLLRLSMVFFKINVLFSIMMLPLASWADSSSVKIGIVVMHGKGGAPNKNVYELAKALEEKGMMVANLEMPWSGKREYDANVNTAENEVESALNSMRSKGATKLFVAGHSQGGAFAIYFGTKHKVDGIIAISPGGNVGAKIYQQKLGSYIEKAHILIEEGRGDEKSSFADFEGSRGINTISTTPSNYVDWFASDGALNLFNSAQFMNAAIPVLYVAPSNDYPALIKSKQEIFGALPENKYTKMYEPNSDHAGAPSASVGEIISWTTTISYLN